MKLGIACDHGGYLLKKEIIEYYKNNNKNIEFIDYGCDSLDSVDYPIYAKKVCIAYQNKDIDFGVLICTTGIGMSISANKFTGIRASLVMNEESAELTRKHNNSNVICLAAKFTKLEDAIKYLDIYLNTKFEGGRHERRVNLIENNIN